MKRKNIPNQMRFEVFKRDKFTCQYCGGKAPDVVLNCDHINPVAEGGTTDLLNLTTSCFTCNSGKSDRKLSDASAVVAARAQAELIEERRDQVRMMAQWQVELARMDVETDALDAAFRTIVNRGLTDHGKKEMRKLARKFGVQEVIAAIAIAYDSYSAEDAYGKISGICRNRQIDREDPETSAINKAFAKLRMIYGNHAAMGEAKGVLREAMTRGLSPERAYRYASEHRRALRSWRDFIEMMTDYCSDNPRIGKADSSAEDVF